MRNISFLSLFLISCSTLKHAPEYHRDLASVRAEASLVFDLQLSRPTVFANGADVVELSVQIKNAAGEAIPLNTTELQLLFDSEVELSKPVIQNAVYKVVVKPAAKSPDIRVAAIFKNQTSQIIKIKTSLSPRIDQMRGLPSGPNNMSWVSGLTYIRSDKFPEGQYEGFSIDNQGNNAIVNAFESSRTFDFSFEEQASQNISLMITDSPNSTVSHSMHSHFMFFPRTYLPIAELQKNDGVNVTLPTGEKIKFNKEREIIGGVFTEGPVDIGPDRFKRTYANFKYQGKGILLRANARGQMPQQGQFEATKIDMEYGIKYSSDVLIINGTTGQRCRRPKTDFWPSGDVNPILFKFPSDKEFDVYLKAKCGFGIPELTPPEMEEPLDMKEASVATWVRCEEKIQIRECLDAEVELIQDKALRAHVKFATSLMLANRIATEVVIEPKPIEKEEKEEEIKAPAPIAEPAKPAALSTPEVRPQPDTQQVLMTLEKLAETKAQSCVGLFPMDGQFNRLRFKQQRESCLLDAWGNMEATALKDSSGVLLEEARAKIALERRRLQLKLIKKYFT